MAQLHYWKWCDELLTRPHLLVAGATGSGKSVMINSLLYTLLTYSPDEKQVMLIDPKRVELSAYKGIPHVKAWAAENSDILALLTRAVDIMNNRYAVMEKHDMQLWEGYDLYIVIDEFADIMVTMPNEVTPLIQRLAQLGRAAKVHLWICTQAPNRQVLKANVILNMTDRIALHCNDRMESRQIIGEKGAELLPEYGKGIYKNPKGLRLVDIPFTPKEDVRERIAFWK